MTDFICFYGGASAGKTTTATHLFALLKQADVNAEIVQEFAKELAWQEYKISAIDQFWIFGEQSHREVSIFNKVDVVLTDSPILIASYYAKLFGSKGHAEAFKAMFQEYMKMATEAGHKFHNIFINRTKKYNPAGRYQTAEQASEIDADMRSFLTELGQTWVEIDGDANAAGRILEMDFVQKIIKEKIN